ncbi:hypothetical protein COU16_00090 [Candidatus Kaiserbacteria bacterium CG10_big_fil_rev_8_21_14_0_10_47_16]|uniref:NodB homology domain-containing protein n=1 Tax=Candidatus Kaiserbacteria bacterium CG10_big_fil_rev_8_21_14_0_10_47_16 TaxID=1974608 RepID=A0A2H0UGV0_9BACT|nr:MAG: hypothetical protein COU16_00090 [Candidatus Kaiserbacteria bacterium CG10_big_fil_rev_8_21_14_0_10_47_16]
MKKILLSLLYGLRNFVDIFLNFNEVTVLCYHSISQNNKDTTIPPELFETHLTALKEAGFSLISLDDVVLGHTGKKLIPRKAVALTFDDGYRDFETDALPILEKYEAPATVFVVGDEGASRGALENTIPLLAPDAIKRLKVHPLVTIGYHSKTHVNLRECSGEVLQSEVAPLFSAEFFAYPGGNYSSEAVRAVREAGYRAAFSIKRDMVGTWSDTFLLPRIVIERKDTPQQVVRSVTVAQHWYAFLRKMTKKYG